VSDCQDLNFTSYFAEDNEEGKALHHGLSGPACESREQCGRSTNLIDKAKDSGQEIGSRNLTPL
jgi:hypothetical protein